MFAPSPLANEANCFATLTGVHLQGLNRASAVLRKLGNLLVRHSDVYTSWMPHSTFYRKLWHAEIMESVGKSVNFKDSVAPAPLVVYVTLVTVFDYVAPALDVPHATLVDADMVVDSHPLRLRRECTTRAGVLNAHNLLDSDLVVDSHPAQSEPRF